MGPVFSWRKEGEREVRDSKKGSTDKEECHTFEGLRPPPRSLSTLSLPSPVISYHSVPYFSIFQPLFSSSLSLSPQFSFTFPSSFRPPCFAVCCLLSLQCGGAHTTEATSAICCPPLLCWNVVACLRGAYSIVSVILNSSLNIH